MRDDDEEEDDDAPTGPTSTASWWENPQNHRKLVQWADQLLRTSGDARIVCLGQSPAWIVKAAEHLCDARGETRSFDYIPFSGRFHHFDRKMRDRYNRTDAQPDATSIRHYRDFLASHSLSPDAIIANFHQNGLSTLIVEYTESRRGLASFMSILLDWSQEEGKRDQLLESLKIVTYAHGRVDAIKPQTLMVDDHPPLAIEHRQINDQLLFALRMNDDSEYASQRFVPRYPAADWLHPPVENVNTDIVQTISTLLQRDAAAFIAQGKSGKGM